VQVVTGVRFGVMKQPFSGMGGPMGGHYGNRNDCCKHRGEHDDDEPGGTIGSLRRGLRDSHGVDESISDELDELHVFSMAGREDSSRDQTVQRFLGDAESDVTGAHL